MSIFIRIYKEETAAADSLSSVSKALLQCRLASKALNDPCSYRDVIK